MVDWEEQFRRWAAPPSDTEEARCETMIREVRRALAESPKLTSRNAVAFVQGFYRNNTNVRRESDVDIGVSISGTFFYDLPEGRSMSDYGIIPSDYTYENFKRDVGEALVEYFGSQAVTRGNKAYDIKASSRQVEADVAPFLKYRRYGLGGNVDEGFELRPDNLKPPRVINWPEQHYTAGSKKNVDTGHRYKGVVRILKTLRYRLLDEGFEDARPIIGFLTECLVFNVPNHNFGNARITDDVRQSISYLIAATSDDQISSGMREVSGLKWIFHPDQKWTRAQAYNFLMTSWRYLGF